MTSKILKFKTTGLSLLQLKDKYGIGPKGFYDNDWWLKEKFASEEPEVGTYEIDTEEKLTNMTYQEQYNELQAMFLKRKLGESEAGWDFPHPAVLAEAILMHYEATGKRLLENWCSRTSSVDSNGHRVYVDRFDSGGLLVHDHGGDPRSSSIGVSACRFLGTGRKKETTPNPSWFKKGDKKVFTEEQRKKISEAEIGEKNILWKGDKVGYRQLHKWVRSRKPVPAVCDNCGEHKKLQLASKNGNYQRTLDEWEYLCVKCHVNKDGTINNLKNVGVARKLNYVLGSRQLGSLEPLGLCPNEKRLMELEKKMSRLEKIINLK